VFSVLKDNLTNTNIRSRQKYANINIVTSHKFYTYREGLYDSVETKQPIRSPLIVFSFPKAGVVFDMIFSNVCKCDLRVEIVL